MGAGPGTGVVQVQVQVGQASDQWATGAVARVQMAAVVAAEGALAQDIPREEQARGSGAVEAAAVGKGLEEQVEAERTAGSSN